jgi:hypothetical protein
MPRGRAGAKLGSDQKAGHEVEKKLTSESPHGVGSSNPTEEEGRQFGGLKRRK